MARGIGAYADPKSEYGRAHALVGNHRRPMDFSPCPRPHLRSNPRRRLRTRQADVLIQSRRLRPMLSSMRFGIGSISKQLTAIMESYPPRSFASKVEKHAWIGSVPPAVAGG